MLVVFRVSWTCLIFANKTLQIELQPPGAPAPFYPFPSPKRTGTMKLVFTILLL